ncbi:glycosyltransferase family 32 protein [Aeromonas media]
MSEKILHCVWFGRGKKSDLIKQCMNSWREYAHDYKVIEWNEDNFDVNCNKYVKQAYDAKKWAFVSDYVRLYALYNYGGVYLDTDVELFKHLESHFLEHEFFSGFELYDGKLSPITALMGAKEKSSFIKKLLDGYNDRSFINEDGEFDLLTNTRVITKVLVEDHGIDPLKDVEQGDEKVKIYPSYYFCNKTDDSYAMHHFDGSWVPKKQKFKKKLLKLLKGL